MFMVKTVRSVCPFKYQQYTIKNTIKYAIVKITVSY